MLYLMALDELWQFLVVGLWYLTGDIRCVINWFVCLAHILCMFSAHLYVSLLY